MNSESVAEFLGGVPLLQRLPSSSLKKIAQLVEVKRFDSGEVVIRHGVDGEGVYFIWEGEAEVYVHAEQEIQPEFQLKRYDYFGNGSAMYGQHADVIASSKLTCLVLPRKHLDLLQPKSIWNANEDQDSCSPLETILHLNSIEVDLFQGITLPDAPQFGKVFGGQFIGQVWFPLFASFYHRTFLEPGSPRPQSPYSSESRALAAASKTVDCLKIFHHFQAYFLLVGDVDIPIIYEVHRIRDGKSFATRRVDAKQKGNTVFTILVSFQKEAKGFEHQIPVLPSVPPPEVLLSMEELRERRIVDPRIPSAYRNKIATTKFIPWPIEIRFCDPNTSTNHTKSPPSLRFWFKAKGKLADDQALHRCVVAYASDLMFIEVSSNPHRRSGLKITCLSLNHTFAVSLIKPSDMCVPFKHLFPVSPSNTVCKGSRRMWFHRNVKADDWILFLVDSPIAWDSRGFCEGKMFNRSGELVVTLVQEGLMKHATLPGNALRAKY